MFQKIINKIKKIFNLDNQMNAILHSQNTLKREVEENRIFLGKQTAHSFKGKKIKYLYEAEFKVFSQWGDDGIIQYLIQNLDIPYQSKIFVEFGVENYTEANTRFLLMNNNWSGLVMDGSTQNMEYVRQDTLYHQHELTAKTAFIDKDNINQLISESGIKGNIGLLSVDIDGNDYWVWEAINVIEPIIVIAEYNAVFGSERAISVPYQPDFYRTKAHYSNLYFGASLPALYHLAQQKNYAFVGCSSSGNNAYFVKKDKLNEFVKEISLKEGFIDSKFRESRNEKGELTFITGKKRIDIIKNMPVIDVITNEKTTI